MGVKGDRGPVRRGGILLCSMFTAVGGSSKLVVWIKAAVLTGIELKVFAPPSDACDI